MEEDAYGDIVTDGMCKGIANITIWPAQLRLKSKVYVKTYDGHRHRECCTKSYGEVMQLIHASFGNKKMKHLIVIAKKLVESYICFVFNVLYDIMPDAQIVFINCLYDNSVFTMGDVKLFRGLQNRIVGCFATQLSDQDVSLPRGDPWSPTLFPIGVLCATPIWCNALVTADTAPSDRLLYINLSVKYQCYAKEDLAGMERRHVVRKLLDNGFALSTFVPHDEMLRRMSSHLFCACPRGIGPDTFRFWEAVSVGSIPIATDWKRLRGDYRGQLPALFVQQTFFRSTFRIHPCRSFELRRGVYVDEFGDILYSKWEHVQKDSLPLLYRFIAWKRYRPCVMRLLFRGTWLARFHACFTA
jgi:hypothetical protein